MECREACKAMTDFLDGTYPIPKQEELIRHVEHCASCREELEICLTLQMALNALDDNTDFIYTDSDEGVKKVLDNAAIKVLNYNRYRRLKAGVTTVAVWAMAVTFCLQVLYWIQTGFWFF